MKPSYLIDTDWVICHNLILLTNNRRHYEVVEGLKMLSLT
jgi:predicted nucleic acid-binding protein